MSFQMAIEATVGVFHISKIYDGNDIIWKKEPEKRLRQMLADVRRQIDGTDMLWVYGPSNGDLKITKTCADGEPLPNVNSREGCRLFSEELVSALIQYSDNITQEPMVVRG